MGFRDNNQIKQTSTSRSVNIASSNWKIQKWQIHKMGPGGMSQRKNFKVFWCWLGHKKKASTQPERSNVSMCEYKKSFFCWNNQNMNTICARASSCFFPQRRTFIFGFNLPMFLPRRIRQFHVRFWLLCFRTDEDKILVIKN